MPANIRTGLRVLVVLLGVLAAPALAAAQGLDGLKIAVVDINEALNRSSAGERSKNILMSSKSQLENELKAKEEELRKLREKLDANIMLSEDARKRKREELQQRARALRQEVVAAQRELKKKERKLTESIFIELKTVIDQIGKEEDYDLILEENASQVILFTSAHIEDITEKVIDRYNKYQSNN